MEAPEAPLRTVERPVPSLQDGEALLSCIYSEVCGTDVHLWHGALAGVPYPLIPGHVAVGTVEQVKGEVHSLQGRPVKEGDLVTFHDVDKTCGRCWTCLVAQQPTRCPHRKVYGITYSSEEGLLGGWAEKILLTQTVPILHLPDELDPEPFIAAGCGGPTGLHAVLRGRVSLGDKVYVQGIGPVGIAACAFAKLCGAEKVIASGSPAARLKAARDMGADETLDIRQHSVEERIQMIMDKTRGFGVDVIIEACGNPLAVKEGVSCLRDGGRYVLVGHYTDAGSVDINPHLDITKKHAEILGCWGTEPKHVWQAMDWIARTRDRLPWQKCISGFYPLEEAEQALRDVEALRVIKAVIAPSATANP